MAKEKKRTRSPVDGQSQIRGGVDWNTAVGKSRLMSLSLSLALPLDHDEEHASGFFGGAIHEVGSTRNGGLMVIRSCSVWPLQLPAVFVLIKRT